MVPDWRKILLPHETFKTLKTGTLTSKKIFDACSNGIIVTNAAGYLVAVNKQTDNILIIPDLENKNAIGSSMCDIFPMTSPLMMRCLESGHPRPGKRHSAQKISLGVAMIAMMTNGCIAGVASHSQGMQTFELLES